MIFDRCLRCSTCGISYPTSHQRPCQVCGGGLDGVQDKPDADWQEKVSLALNAIQSASEDDKVFGWRLRVLVFAGAPVRLAEKVAHRRDIDLHTAEKVVKGTNAETAERILL